MGREALLMNRWLTPVRMAAALRQQGGFVLAWSTRVGETGFSRDWSTGDLFEQIWIHTSGRSDEALTAYAGISVVWGRAPKGLVELELLKALSTDERGYAEIASERDAQQWLATLALCAEPTLVSVRAKAAPRLLEATAEARRVASRYAALVPRDLDDIAGLRSWAQPDTLTDQQRLAEQLAGIPGLVMSNEDKDYVEVAALLIAGPGRHLPETPETLQASPIANPPAAWRVSILADLLKRRFLERDSGRRVAPLA